MATLVDVDTYIAKNLKAREKMPKKAKDKRAWLKKKGLKTVKDPKSGKMAIPVHDKTIMLTGTRLSAKSSREEAVESKEEAKAVFAKHREKMDVQTNTKAAGLQPVNRNRPIMPSATRPSSII